MLDKSFRRLIDPLLTRSARLLARTGTSADTVTILGFVFGMAAAAAIAGGMFGTGVALFLLGRLLDGLDGAVARIHGKTDRGGYLDIVLDFFVYAAIPLAFAVHEPNANALPAAALLASFILNGVAFLAFAVMSERRGLTPSAHGEKSLYVLAGLAEGFETISIFVLMCIFPASFPLLALGFAAICTLSAIGRLAVAWRRLA